MHAKNGVGLAAAAAAAVRARGGAAGHAYIFHLTQYDNLV